MYFVHIYGIHVYRVLVDLDSSGSPGVRQPPRLTSNTQVVFACARAYTSLSTHPSTTLTPATIEKYTKQNPYLYSCQLIALHIRRAPVGEHARRPSLKMHHVAVREKWRVNTEQLKPTAVPLRPCAAQTTPAHLHCVPPKQHPLICNSNSHGFKLHKPSIKGTKLLLQETKAIIII